MVVVAIIVAAAGALWPRSGAVQAGSESPAVSTETVSGVTAVAMKHEQLISLPEDSTEPVAPALESYVVEGTSTSSGAGVASGLADAGTDAGTGGASDSAGTGAGSATGSDSGATDSGSPTTTYDLSQVSNLSDFTVLEHNENLQNALKNNGFVINAASGNYYEFFEQYEYNRYSKVASYVTTDSMMHTYHLYFNYLLKNSEKNMLSSRLLTMSQALLTESADQYATLKGSEWESAAGRNVVYFAVACELMGGEASVPADLANTVNAEVSKINEAQGISSCALLGGDAQEDYSQYKPRGYYSGDEQLERYFRTMMWYGRINFTQSDEDLDRSACLIALDIHNVAEDDWKALYTITSFFAGASDDSGYYEYYPIVEAVYGADARASDLVGDVVRWNTFHQMTKEMPAPQINSVAYFDYDDDQSNELEEQKGFRLMGQRFTLDESIFEKLIVGEVGENSAGEERLLPSALDVPAALGSDTALNILDSEGATSYEGYTDNIETLRTSIANADSSLWTASLSSQWLYTLNPLLSKKDSSYPSVMQSEAWSKKNLQTYLGSYTELKHDTVLYAKQIMSEMGGNIPERDDRGYVEPETEVYIRLANLTESTAKGLEKYGAISEDDVNNLATLASLSRQLAAISEKELAGEECTTDEYELIRSYGGQIEHFWKVVCQSQTTKSSFQAKEFPAALVTDIASSAISGQCLEIGTGYTNTIYVLFQINGEWHVGAGSVFSFYEFTEPLSDRLTDTDWRLMMGIESADGKSYSKTAAISQPAWTDGITVRK